MADDFQFLTDLQRTVEAPDGVDLATGEAVVQIRAVARGVWRVRVVPSDHSKEDEPLSYAPDPTRAHRPPNVEREDDADSVILKADGWKAVATRSPLRVHFEAPDGHRFAADSSGPGWRSGRFHIWKNAAPETHYYGLGEKAYPLDRAGRYFTNWNTDTPAYEPETDPLYKTIPFFSALEKRDDGSRFVFGLLLDNAHRSYFDFGGQAVGHVSMGADGGDMSYYVFGGPTFSEVIRQYTDLTGRMPLPPLWSLGYQQSRWSYYPDEEVRHLVAHFRSRGFPLDVLYLDIHYMHEYRVFTWNPHRFPDHRRLLADLRDQGVRTVIIVDPGIKADAEYNVAKEGLDGDHFIRYPDGTVYQGKVWPGACYFPDFTRPDTRDWFGSHCRVAMDDGVSGFWTDMNEPSNHSHRTLPDHVRHDLEGRGGSHMEAHNVYGHLMARSAFEAAAAHRPDERPFVLTRAAFAGSQRYAAVWTGDNVSSWEHLGLAVPMLLSLGISGVPFAGSDVGGFFGSPSAELFVRWMQLGTFSPLFRNHSIFASRRQEPWAFGEVAEEAARSAVELRYRLLPYLYTLFAEHARNGLPPMRPLVLHYADDDEAATLDDQFLFGEHLLVAPVVREGAESRSVYLPAGDWYEFGRSTLHRGPTRVVASAPLSIVPIFVRAGTCLPLGPVLQHVEERPVHELTLEIYPGNGSSGLYEDDGKSQAYRSGSFRSHTFEMQAGPDAVALRHVVDGSFDEGVRTFNVRVAGHPKVPDSTLTLDATFEDATVPLRS